MGALSHCTEHHLLKVDMDHRERIAILAELEERGLLSAWCLYCLGDPVPLEGLERFIDDLTTIGEGSPWHASPHYGAPVTPRPSRRGPGAARPGP